MLSHTQHKIQLHCKTICLKNIFVTYTYLYLLHSSSTVGAYDSHVVFIDRHAALAIYMKQLSHVIFLSWNISMYKHTDKHTQTSQINYLNYDLISSL